MKTPCDDCANSGKCNRQLSCPDKVASLAGLTISTAQTGYEFTLGEAQVTGRTLKACILALGRAQGWGVDEGAILTSLKSLPESDNRGILLGILEQ